MGFVLIRPVHFVVSANDWAVSEPAKTILLKYFYSRNQATYGLFHVRLVAGWDGGRRRRPQPETDLAWGSSNRGRVGGCPKLRIAGLVSQRFSPNTYEVSRPCPN